MINYILKRPILDSEFYLLSSFEQQRQLISKGVYTFLEFQTEKPFEPIDSIFPIIKRSEEKPFFIGDMIAMYNKRYDISPNLLAEILEKIKSRIIYKVEDDFRRNQTEIWHLIVLSYSNKDAVELLKEKRKEYLNSYLNEFKLAECGYIYSSKNIEEENYDIYSEFSNTDLSDQIELIKDYLFTAGGSIQKAAHITDFWHKVILLEQSIKECSKKINELETINFKNQIKQPNPELSILIFKKQGEIIFNYVVSKYPKEKNTAFFSYLYFFLKDDLKLLLITGNDSKDYRNFIINKYNISFSRIQKSKSENQYKREEIITLFKEYASEVTQLRIE